MLTRYLPWKRVKPADPMQTVQPEPRTEDVLDAVARKYKSQADLWQHVARRTQADLDTVRGELAAVRAAHYATMGKLGEIAALETPGSAPAAKRMARIAREALPEYAAADREAA